MVLPRRRADCGAPHHRPAGGARARRGGGDRAREPAWSPTSCAAWVCRAGRISSCGGRASVEPSAAPPSPRSSAQPDTRVIHWSPTGGGTRWNSAAAVNTATGEANPYLPEVAADPVPVLRRRCDRVPGRQLRGLRPRNLDRESLRGRAPRASSPRDLLQRHRRGRHRPGSTADPPADRPTGARQVPQGHRSDTGPARDRPARGRGQGAGQRARSTVSSTAVMSMPTPSSPFRFPAPCSSSCAASRSSDLDQFLAWKDDIIRPATERHRGGRPDPQGAPVRRCTGTSTQALDQRENGELEPTS